MNKMLLAFFTLSYALSWCVFVPLALQAQSVLSGLPAWLHLLAAYGPLLAAFITALAFEGAAGARRLVSQMTRWRIGWGWWLAAVASPLLFFVGAVLLSRLFGSPAELTAFGRIAELPGLSRQAGWAVWILTFGLGEETGWRGFALPRFQQRYSARTATLILGLLWAAWHAPTFFYTTNSRPSACWLSRSVSCRARCCSPGFTTAPAAACWRRPSGTAPSTRPRPAPRARWLPSSSGDAMGRRVSHTARSTRETVAYLRRKHEDKPAPHPDV